MLLSPQYNSQINKPNTERAYTKSVERTSSTQGTSLSVSDTNSMRKRENSPENRNPERDYKSAERTPVTQGLIVPDTNLKRNRENSLEREKSPDSNSQRSQTLPKIPRSRTDDSLVV